MGCEHTVLSTSTPLSSLSAVFFVPFSVLSRFFFLFLSLNVPTSINMHRPTWHSNKTMKQTLCTVLCWAYQLITLWRSFITNSSMLNWYNSRNAMSLADDTSILSLIATDVKWSGKRMFECNGKTCTQSNRLINYIFPLSLWSHRRHHQHQQWQWQW